MGSRRQVLCVAGAMVLLPALAGCQPPRVRVDWLERMLRDHPAVASVDLHFTQCLLGSSPPDLFGGGARLKRDVPADQVVDLTRSVTELVHSNDSTPLTGQMDIWDAGYEGGLESPGKSFTFPDFSRFPSVEVVDAATRHWLDMASRYESCSVVLDWDRFRPDTPQVHTGVKIDENVVPAALATAFGDFARHGLPSSVTTSWGVGIPDLSYRIDILNASRSSRYGSTNGPANDAVLQAMMSLATLNKRLNPDEHAEIDAYWRSEDGQRYFLDVGINLRPRELRDLPTDKIEGAIPGSTAPRTANTFVEPLDNAGIPYTLEVRVRDRGPILTLDRATN